MSLISGMDEVIAYIKTQDEKIKNLETNETVREELIVELQEEAQSIQKAGIHLAMDNTKLKKENEKLKKENEKLKGNQECEEDGYCISTWFREKLDIYIKYQFTQDGGEYTYHFQPNERPTCLDDLFEKYEKLKEKNDKFTKMFDAFPNDMDIFSWDEKREMWRHDEDEVSDEEEE